MKREIKKCLYGKIPKQELSGFYYSTIVQIACSLEYHLPGKSKYPMSLVKIHTVLYRQRVIHPVNGAVLKYC